MLSWYPSWPFMYISISKTTSVFRLNFGYIKSMLKWYIFKKVQLMVRCILRNLPNHILFAFKNCVASFLWEGVQLFLQFLRKIKRNSFKKSRREIYIWYNKDFLQMMINADFYWYTRPYFQCWFTLDMS